MKKKWLAVIIPLFLVLFAITYFEIQYPRMDFEKLLGTDEANITKVYMINSFTGRRIEATNKEKLKELFNMLDERTYRKAFKQTLRTGYLYAYDFYSGDKMLLTIVGSGKNIHIYNQERTIDAYYDVSKKISIDWIEKWFNSIPAKK